MQPWLVEDLEANALFTPRPPKVLVVEADESARSVLAVTLKASGLEVLEAETGAQALQLLKTSDVALAIVSSDLAGEEDGFSVVAQMRGEGPDLAMPVVLLAKGEQAQLRELSKVVDAQEVLLKPAFAKEVAAVAVMHLSERSLDGTVKLDSLKAPPNQLLRALLNGERAGVFELCGGRAHVAFRQGMVIDAQVDRQHGTDALVKALALHVGPYRVAFRPVQFAPAFQLGVREMLHRIEPRLRAFSELATQLDLETRLGIEFAALARALPSLPDAANSIVRLFDGVRTVRQAVLDSSYDELLSLQVTQKLIGLGIIKPLTEPKAAPAVPQLFGPGPADADQQMAELFSGAPLQVAPEAAQAEATDWADTLIRGEPEGDPSAGWVAGKLEPELAKQLEAFDIRAVEEPAKAEQLPPAVQELKEFAAPIPLTEAVQPLPLTEQATPIEAASLDALESSFYEHPSRSTVIPEGAQAPEFRPTAPSPPAGSLPSEAVASGLVTMPNENRRGTLIGVAAVLLVVAVAIVAAMFAQDNKAPVEKQPAVAVAPAPPSQPLPEAAPVAPVARPETADELKAATALYESGKVKEAVAALEKIVAADPSSGQSWLLLGLARYDSGDTPGAQEAANTVLALEPTNARAHLLLATILIDANNREAANVEIQKYLDADPKGVFADEARALLKR